MAELGSGAGTSYPTSLDTDSVLEVDLSTVARADVPNDLAAAVIAAETTLGITGAFNFLPVDGSQAMGAALDMGGFAITNVGNVDGIDLSAHVADGTIHFLESAIDHTNILNIGTNSHVDIDSHIADSTVHFTEGSIDHGSIAGIGDDDHPHYLLAAGTRALTGHWDAGAFNITLGGSLAAGGTSTDHTLITAQASGGDCKIDLTTYNYPLLNLDIFEMVPRSNDRDDGTDTAQMMFIQNNLGIRGTGGSAQLILYSSDLSVSGTVNMNTTTGVITAGGNQWSFSNPPTSPGPGANSEEWGNGAQTVGAGDHAIGSSTYAQGLYSLAVGYSANASGGSATAVGSNSVAGSQACAFGRNSNASLIGSLAMGIGATASSVGATALGWNASASQSGAFAMGALTSCSGTSSVAVAYLGNVSGGSSVGIGVLAAVAHDNSVGIGAQVATTKTNQFISGSGASPIVEFLIGNGATHAAPQTQTLFTTTSGSGTDIAGTNFVIQPGAGTGSGAGGDFIVQTATPGGSGSGLNSYTTALTIDDQQKALFAAEVEIDGDLNHDGSNVGFYGTAPTTQPTALTTQLTDLSGDVTPGTPDYALTATNSGWGCGSQDEFETMTSVILNLQTRVDELETKLQSLGLLA